MVFNVGKIKSTIQQLGQKLTPDKIHQFGTKLRVPLYKLVERLVTS